MSEKIMPKRAFYESIILFIIAVVVFLSGYVMLREDFYPFLQWWATVFYIGIIFIPITALLFNSFHDKGYLFSKTIGIAVTAYLMWFLSSVRLLKFTERSCLICVGIGLILNVITFVLIDRKNKREGKAAISLTIFQDGTLNRILSQEVFFLAVFLLFTYVRGFKPEAVGTEKPMDYGFMTSMMRSDYMPPEDFWFSGTNLNYYYVGQFIATFLTKLSFVKVSVGYNIALMMIGAFAVVLPYSLIYNVFLKLLKKQEKKVRIISIISGLIAGIGVCIAGNMHYPVYKWLEPNVRKFFGIEASTDGYWFPDATRFIGYHPETHDKTIHEFPCYSFVLGDLHAHVINIMFVLTVLGLLFAWLCKRKEEEHKRLSIIKEVCNPQLIAISFFIGLFHTTNYWDFPIYYVVSGAIILFTNLIVYNFRRKALWITAIQGVFVWGISRLVCEPFVHSFHQISTTPLLTVSRTPLNQLMILWGLPVFTVISFLCFMVANYKRKRMDENQLDTSNMPSTPSTSNKDKKSTLFTFMASLTEADLFILIIGLCAIGLVLMPEVIYIEDIYNGDYKRANTMFKLTYQAFIMFGLCFGYIFTRLIMFRETKRQLKIAITGLVLFSFSVCYVQNAVNSWYGNIFDYSRYQGLDCTAFMETNTTYQDDVGAIDWLNKNVTGNQVVLEANGDSYTDYNRVSVMTGLPTVLGWRTHEWLWKSDTTEYDKRAADIEVIYTSEDVSAVKALLKEYKVAYLYVGKLEQDKFTNINHTLLKSLGEVVYISPAFEDKIYETYIVKISS